MIIKKYFYVIQQSLIEKNKRKEDLKLKISM